MVKGSDFHKGEKYNFWKLQTAQLETDQDIQNGLLHSCGTFKKAHGDHQLP